MQGTNIRSAENDVTRFLNEEYKAGLGFRVLHHLAVCNKTTSPLSEALLSAISDSAIRSLGLSNVQVNAAQLRRCLSRSQVEALSLGALTFTDVDQEEGTPYFHQISERNNALRNAPHNNYS